MFATCTRCDLSLRSVGSRAERIRGDRCPIIRQSIRIQSKRVGCGAWTIVLSCPLLDVLIPSPQRCALIGRCVSIAIKPDSGLVCRGGVGRRRRRRLWRGRYAEYGSPPAGAECRTAGHYGHALARASARHRCGGPLRRRSAWLSGRLTRPTNERRRDKSTSRLEWPTGSGPLPLGRRPHPSST